MFYLHVYMYVCTVHILYMKMHCYFLLNIKHGPQSCILGSKYNCEAPERGLCEAAGEGREEGMASLRPRGRGL